MNKIASIIGSGINGNWRLSGYITGILAPIASIIGSGINGNVELCAVLDEAQRLSLLLLEVELMETQVAETLEQFMFNIASIIGSGINGN